MISRSKKKEHCRTFVALCERPRSENGDWPVSEVPLFAARIEILARYMPATESEKRLSSP